MLDFYSSISLILIHPSALVDLKLARTVLSCILSPATISRSEIRHAADD